MTAIFHPVEPQAQLSERKPQVKIPGPILSPLPSLIMTKTEKVVHSFCELESNLPPEAKQILQEITMGQRSARALEDNFDRSTPPGTKP